MLDIVATMSEGDFRINAPTALVLMFYECIYLLAPIIAVVLIAGIIGNYGQFGVIFTLEKLAPNFDHINPIEGAKRLFSMEKLFGTFKELTKIILLSFIFYILIRDSFAPYLLSLSCGLHCQSVLTALLIMKLIIYSSILFIFIAVADFAFQKWDYYKNLKMSKHELKRERKESEGDPQIKRQRKEFGRELIMSDSGEQARNGTAVVVNPTHIAVIIKYEKESRTLPSVTAKGMDHKAAYLRGEAENAGVPVFRNVKLAHALYHTTEVGGYIPNELYDVVAEVLVWVAQNRELLYKGPLQHGVIDMDMEHHKAGMKGLSKNGLQ